MSDSFEDRMDRMRQTSHAGYSDVRRRVFGEAADRLRPRVEPLPATAGMSIQEVLLAYGEWSARALERERQELIEERIPVRPAAADSAPTAATTVLPDPAQPLAEVDGLVRRLFDVDSLTPVATRVTGVTVCQNSAEFLAPLTAIGLSLPEQRTLLQQASQGRAVPALERAVYYLPGHGCFVNGPRVVERSGATDVAAALSDSDTFFVLVREITEVVWGWGFILDYSRYGAERHRLGLWQNELRAFLGLNPLPHPHQASADVAAYFAHLTARAWTAWVGEEVLRATRHQRLGGQPPPPARRGLLRILGRLAQEVALQIPFAEVIDGVLETIQDVLSNDEAGLRAMHRRVNSFRRWADTYQELIQQRFGRSSADWLAGWLLEKVESQVGTYCLPYAVLIASHVEYSLDKFDADTLRIRIESAPREAIDTRLRMLAGLETFVKYDVQAVATAAWERLQLDSPDQLRHFTRRNRG